jgi:hypothetical protein
MAERSDAGIHLGLSTVFARKARRSRGPWRVGIEALEGRKLLSAGPVPHHHGEAGRHGGSATTSSGSSAPTGGLTPVTVAPVATTVSTAPTTVVATGSVTAVPSGTPGSVTNPIAGDINSDGVVDMSDYNILVVSYKKVLTGATWPMGDFNGDGAVNFADFAMMAANFGKTGGTPVSGGSGSGTITPTASAPPSNITWSGTLVVTRGGTYTGNWQSTRAGTPAVSIQTTQPVTILNSNIQSRGNLVQTDIDHANVTILNTHGWALNPNVSGQSPGRFLNAEKFDNVDVENNTMVGTAGIEMGYYMGNGTASQTVKVLKNNALNIDGRWSDGNGGYQTGADANDYVQFAQFNQCFNMVGVEIAWNQVVNQPGMSRPEDNISVFESSGASSSPILIHDNYIQGAYAADPANDSSYTGGGIMLSDGTTGSSATATGNVSAYNNIIISTSNYGIAISSGHNDSIYNNTIISSDLLPSGQKIAAENVGIYVWNSISDPNWANNKEYGNTIGWMGPSGRNDKWIPNSANNGSDAAVSGSITRAVEQSYYSVWATKVAASGYTVGAA